MEKYKKFIVPAIALGVFIGIAIPVTLYILSLPLSQIASNGCRGFSGYQLSNCIAYYQRQGDLGVLQLYAQIALWTLWIGLFTGGVCTFFVFPRIYAEPMTYGFCFALSLVIGCLALGLFLVSPTKGAVATKEPASSMQQK